MEFSVLMSLYIKEKVEFLEECFVGLESQSVKSGEVVLVFDGEITPELESVVSKYNERLNLKIVKLSRNVGLGKALNEGLKHCTNEWVFRADTDDIYLPDRFEKQIKYINENPDVVLFGSHIAEFEGNRENIVGHRIVPVTVEHIRKMSLIRSPFNHVSVAFKKSVVESVGGYKHHMFFEDYNLWLRIIALGAKVGNIDDVLVLCRAGIGMIGRRRGWLYVKSEWKMFKLKRELGMQGIFVGFFVFMLRAVPRVLPAGILKLVYKFLRKK